jgi:hypothetical protein
MNNKKTYFNIIIYALVFQVVSGFQFFQQNLFMLFSSLLCYMRHPSHSLAVDNHNVVKSTNYEALHCAVSLILVVLVPCYRQIFSLSPYS